MTIFFGFLHLLLFVVFVAGLVKPSLVLRWSQRPTRPKVFGYWVLVAIVIAMVAIISESEEDKARRNIEMAKGYIDEENYVAAISRLEDIRIENPLYGEAQILLTQADSLLNIFEEEKKLAAKLEVEKKAEDERQKQKEQLEREIDAVSAGVDFSAYQGTIEALQIELALFGLWANIILEGEASDDPEIQELAKELKPKVVKLQLGEFPRLRREYAQVVNQKLWESDIEVFSNGTGNRYINFTGGVFATNQNKRDFQIELQEVLTMFRFRQSRYKWYKGDDEYTYWTMYEGSDSELVIFGE